MTDPRDGNRDQAEKDQILDTQGSGYFDCWYDPYCLCELCDAERDEQDLLR